MTKIIVNTLLTEKRFAILKNNRIEQLLIEQPADQTAVGNIYYGTVSTVVPGMNAAFVNFGEGKNGFLYCADVPGYVAEQQPTTKTISNFVHVGEKLLVQVKKDQTNMKGAKLSAIIELESDLLIYMPAGKYVAVSKKMANNLRNKWREFGKNNQINNEGFIFRTACEQVSEDEVLFELNLLREKYRQILSSLSNQQSPSLIYKRETFVTTLLNELKLLTDVEIEVDDSMVKKEIERSVTHREDIVVSQVREQKQHENSIAIDNAIIESMKRIVWLKNGAYLVFDETEALTVVDVNSGKYVGKTNLQKTILQVNELALREAARQIQLRNYGGIILIDLINMKNAENRKDILKLTKKLFATDRKRTSVIGFTELGILQLTRKKTTASLSEVMSINCPECNGTGKVLSAESAAFQLERTLYSYRYSDAEAVLVDATADIINLYSFENTSFKTDLEEKLHFKIYFREIKNSSPKFEIIQLSTEAIIKERI